MSSSRRRANRRRCATPTACSQVVGKRFNAFAAEQWLTADGDGRDPAQARAIRRAVRPGRLRRRSAGRRIACVVIDRLAFDEDCARAEIVVSALTAPSDCKAKFVFDERALARLGAVGLNWGDEAASR